MNLLMLTPMPPDERAPGAIPVLLAATLRGLVARHRVTLVTVAGPDPAELDAVRRCSRELGVEVLAAERRPLQGRSLLARRRRMAQAWLEGPWPWRVVWFWQPRVQALVDRACTQRHYDAIVADDDAMGVYQLPTGPVRVLTEHEVVRPEPVHRPPGHLRELPGWVVREVDRWRTPAYQRSLWPRFDVVQVYTDRDADDVRRFAPEVADRVRVNPFAIRLPTLTAGSEQPGRVVFLGNYLHAPNADAALRLGRTLMPMLRTRHPGVRLALAGAHPPREVRALACDDIEVCGFVQDADAFLREAAVVLAPVREGGGMRMKVLHAMALGRAVVTTPLGAQGLGADAPLVVADDDEALARETARLLGDESARRALGASARAHVERHYTPEAYAGRLEALCLEARACA